MNALNQYIDSLIESAGLTNLPPDLLNEQKERLEEQLQNRVGAVLLSALEEKDLKDYEKMLANQKELDPEELQMFLQSKIANYDQLLSQALQDFAQDFLQAFK